MSTAEQKPVRVRIAPSPTGNLHIGTARTALFNWLFARKHGGSFILRIEDTDMNRSTEEYEAVIYKGLRWLGIEWDEGPDENGVSRGTYGPYRQSERTALYRPYIERLISEKKAYFCYCSKEVLDEERRRQEEQKLPARYSGKCRHLAAPPAGKEPEVIRFAMPAETIAYDDMIRGTVEFEASLFGDIVIAKDLDTPLFNFANVIDDELMKISHVIRGEDHISNTPKQILLQKALGFEHPAYAHIPLILNNDRSKLSKRKNQTSIEAYKNEGYLPEAMINFLALLGWHGADDREIYAKNELIAEFSLERVQKSGAIFDIAKLRWLNHRYITALSERDYLALALAALPEDHPGRGGYRARFDAAAVGVKERLNVMSELPDLISLYFELTGYDGSLLVWKKDDAERTKKNLIAVKSILENIGPDDFTEKRLEEALEPLAGTEGKGSVYWPLRVALSGLEKSPGPLEIARIIGRDETLRRIDDAITKL